MHSREERKKGLLPAVPRPKLVFLERGWIALVGGWWGSPLTFPRAIPTMPSQAMPWVSCGDGSWKVLVLWEEWG